MDGFPTIVLVFFGIVDVFIIGSGIAMFVFQAKVVGKVFKIATKELDRRVADSEEPEKVECEHCGTLATPGEDCSNCGASRGLSIGRSQAGSESADNPMYYGTSRVTRKVQVSTK